MNRIQKAVSVFSLVAVSLFLPCSAAPAPANTADKPAADKPATTPTPAPANAASKPANTADKPAAAPAPTPTPAPAATPASAPAPANDAARRFQERVGNAPVPAPANAAAQEPVVAPPPVPVPVPAPAPAASAPAPVVEEVEYGDSDGSPAPVVGADTEPAEDSAAADSAPAEKAKKEKVKKVKKEKEAKPPKPTEYDARSIRFGGRLAYNNSYVPALTVSVDELDMATADVVSKSYSHKPGMGGSGFEIGAAAAILLGGPLSLYAGLNLAIRNPVSIEGALKISEMAVNVPVLLRVTEFYPAFLDIGAQFDIPFGTKVKYEWAEAVKSETRQKADAGVVLGVGCYIIDGLSVDAKGVLGLMKFDELHEKPVYQVSVGVGYLY